MDIVLAALVYYLTIMPTGGTRTPENRELYKPFSVMEQSFPSEQACKDYATANLKALLNQHGLPADATGNFNCGVNR